MKKVAMTPKATASRAPAPRALSPQQRREVDTLKKLGANKVSKPNITVGKKSFYSGA